jgi:hypothetical protein
MDHQNALVVDGGVGWKDNTRFHDVKEIVLVNVCRDG